MKFLLLAVPVLGVLGYAWSSRAEANVYAMTPDQAYAALVATPVKPSGTGVFGRLVTSVGGDGSSTVRWHATGSHASIECEANIAPEGADKSRVMAHCGGASPSSGAASGMLMGMKRNALIEHIDATLRKRPYDVRLALGSTASGWPKDSEQPDASYGAAVGEALKMDRDMQKMVRESRQDDAQARVAREHARINQGTNFTPGQPMIDPSK